MDVGKSTLSGRVLLDCGEVKEDELRTYKLEAQKNKREMWYMAYMTDIN